MSKTDTLATVALVMSMVGAIVSTSILKSRIDTVLNKATRVETKVTQLEGQLTGRCEPSLENEKRCTRIQYLYKNGHFRGVKCLRWED